MSDQLLTRSGARELTQTIDRIATVVQNNADILGIEPKIARDFALRSDLISDAVETTASINFPLREAGDGDMDPEDQAALEEDADPKSDDQNTRPNATSGEKMAVDEEEESVEPTGGYDPNLIGDQVDGPLEIVTPPSEPWMGGEFTQQEFHELGEKQEAGVIPGVDKFAAYLDRAERLFLGASKLPDIAVQGYAGFTDQIRKLEDLTTEAQELRAQVDALIPDELLKAKTDADKEVKKAQEAIKKAYKENLTSIGNITIERKTQLVEARAMIKVTESKAKYIKDIQAELIAAAVEQYGEDMGEFIKTTIEALQTAKKSMSASFKGFELEQRALRTASFRSQAGVADLLVRFYSFLVKGWKRLVQTIQTAAALVKRAAKPADKSHKELMSVLKDANTGKLAASEEAAPEEADEESKKAGGKEEEEADEESKKASDERYAGFNLFA